MAEQGVPPRGRKFGDPDHPMTPEKGGEAAWQAKRAEVLRQYPNLAATAVDPPEPLEEDDDADA